jgi:hypothetical protein
VVAVASPSVAATAARRRRLGWAGASAAVLVVGLGLRLALGGAGLGDRSALVMATLLTVCAWLAARLVGGARTAFLVGLGLMAVLDLAALPPRGAPEYDEVQAWYRTDQVVSAQVVPSSTNASSLRVMAQPVFDAGQPRFGLAGEVNGVSVSWTCRFARESRHLVLPIPREALGGSGSSVDVRLHLTGSPTRESDYLILYLSSRRGGPLITLDGDAAADQTATTCSAA